MKKIIFSLIALAAAATSFAQFPAGLSVGVGYSLISKELHVAYPLKIDETSKLSGFSAGVDYNIAIGQTGLGVAPGIWFQFSKGEYFPGIADQDLDWNESSILVPLSINYSIPVADVLKIVPYLGPTFEYNISSKGKKGDETESLYDQDGSKYKHCQLYLGGGIALDVADIIRVSVGYDFGLLNRIQIDGFDKIGTDYYLKDKGRLNLGIAYFF